VRRFQRVLDHVGAGASFRWADVAAACGYYDQPHLVRDFRAFSGVTPSSYAVSTSPDRRNHLPLG
jgi:AraC-like DNA-binding protein